MTKQEKIRAIVKNHLVGAIHGARVHYDDLSGYNKSTIEFLTDELLEEMSNQGVVIKKERELPLEIALDERLVTIRNGVISISVALLKSAGLTAFEPLIEDVKNS